MRLGLRVIGTVGAIGLGLVLVGVIVGPPRISLEGAYFTYSPHGPADAGVFHESHPGLFDLADGNLWIGAGIVLLILAVVGLLVVRLRSD